MSTTNTEQRRRAWVLAHKIISVVAVIPHREKKTLLVVKTEAITKALGTADKAKLEEVQRFVFDVISFMKGYGVFIACGCGYLSLMVCPAEGHETILENRDTTTFTPEDIDAYFEEHVLNRDPLGRETVLEICDNK